MFFTCTGRKSENRDGFEYILNCETLVDQYKKSLGEKYPNGMTTATLLRCAPQKLGEFMFHNQTTRQETSYRTFFDWGPRPDISG